MGQKEAYLEKMDAQLREWKGRLDVLVAQADQTKADAKIEYHNRVKEMRKQRKELERRLDELRKAGEDGWKDVQARIEKGRRDLDKSIQDLQRKLEGE